MCRAAGQDVVEMPDCIYSHQQSTPYSSSLSTGTDPQQEWLPRHISSCGLTADLKVQLLSKGKLLFCRIHNHLWHFSKPFSKGKLTIQQTVHQHEGGKGLNQWYQFATFAIEHTEARSTLMQVPCSQDPLSAVPTVCPLNRKGQATCISPQFYSAISHRSQENGASFEFWQRASLYNCSPEYFSE